MAQREFDRGWDAYERTEVYSDWVVAQKGLGSDDSEPYYDMVYCKSMREAADREVNPEEEAHSLDPRGNYPNGACSPQGYWISDEDYDLSRPAPLAAVVLKGSLLVATVGSTVY